MTCPSRDRLARAALGLDQDVSDHLAACPGCRAELAAMQSVVDRLAEGHAALDRGHEEARERLLSLLPDEAPRPEPAGVWISFIQWMGGSTMRRRMVFGGLGTLGVLMVGLLWMGFAVGRASAMDAVAEAVRKARSYQFTMTIEPNGPRADGSPPPKPLNVRYARAADGSTRADSEGGSGMPGSDVLEVMPAGRPGISVDRKTRTFTRRAPELGRTSPLWMMEGLAAFSGDADRDLGEKVVDGDLARGFRIASEKIDPDVHFDLLEVWVDAAAHLPVSMSFTMADPSGPIAVRLHDFAWDVDLAPGLFDTTPPEGYADVTPAPMKLADQVAKIALGLKTYAKYGGGHYPRVAMLYGDATRDELIKLSGAPYPPRTEADSWDPRVAEVEKAIQGFGPITAILRDNPDAAYHGKTVGPGNKDQVLLRWKSDGGLYHVLFGDLRYEIVDAARLKMLERKPAG